MNIEPEIAVAELLDRDSIIEIFCVFAVDRYSKQITLVTPSC